MSRLKMVISREKSLIIKNFFVSVIAQIINLFFLFFINILIIRYLGPTNYGHFVLVFGVFMVVWYFVESSLAPIIIREINSSSDSLFIIQRRFFSPNIILAIIGCFFLLLFSFIFASYDKEMSIFNLGLALSIALINVLFATYFAAFFRGKEKFFYVGLGTTMHKCLLLLFILCIIKFNGGIVGVGLAYAFAAIFLLAYYVYIFIRCFGIIPTISFDFSEGVFF